MANSSPTERLVKTWDEYSSQVSAIQPKWIFRGQQAEHTSLQNTLERIRDKWEIEPSMLQNVERGMIREFRRRYNRPDAEKVQNDTLYCMAIMRHHGAPSRLLDFTYSPYMAAYFALKEGNPRGVIKGRVWAIRVRWIYDRVCRIFNRPNMKWRDADLNRKDASFRKMYMSRSPKTFVYHENPIYLGGNPRLMQQQGTFLCPGNVTLSFEKNISAMPGSDDGENLRVFRFEMETADCVKTLDTLHRHGLNEGNLFPDLDGFSRQLGVRACFYASMSLQGVGTRETG